MTTIEILKIVGLSLMGATLINGIIYKYWLLPKLNKDFKSFESKLKRQGL